MKEIRNRLGNVFRVFVVFFIMSIFLPALASSEEIFEFERMWPTLQQPWYFNRPTGIAIDENGYVFVADKDNNRIMKLTLDGQFVVAWGNQGNGDGEFDRPFDVTVDPDGFVYVADEWNHRIQKFTSNGKFVKKWIGNIIGEGSFFYPRGIAADNAGFIYVTDVHYDKVLKFTTDGEFINEWGALGTQDGEFDAPVGIAVDENSVVFVVDINNARIQKFTSEGQFLGKWGSQGKGDGEFYYPEYIAIDSGGLVYVTDAAQNHRIQKFTADGVFLTKWGGLGYEDGEFYYPSGIVLDSRDNVYVVDYINNRIQKFTDEGLFLDKWGGLGQGDGEFNDHHGMVFDENDFIYVADTLNNWIQKFTADGKFILKWGNEGTGDGQFKSPTDVAIGASGNVYVTDTNNNRVQKFTSEGDFLLKWGNYGSGDGQFWGLNEIAVDSENFVYVTDRNNHRVQKFTSDGVFVNKWGSQGGATGQFYFPQAIEVDSTDNLYIVDSYNFRIQKFTTNGVFLDEWGTNGNGDGQFEWPFGLAIDRNDNNNIYVSDISTHRIQKFNANGDFITAWGYIGNSPGEVNTPWSLAVSSNGNVYVGDRYNYRIQVFRKITSSRNTKAVIVAGGGPFAGNNLWDATQMCSNFAYRAMTYQGFTKASIHYLSSDIDLDLDGNGILDDVDGDATNGKLQQAITIWASDAEDLVLYLVDHGGDGTFRMSASETLSATDLDTWLDQLQAVIAGKVIVVYDACESGSFLTSLTPPAGKDRIVITSTSPSESAYFVAQGSVSFSNFFWTHIFNGVNVKDAFELSSQAIGYTTGYQNPLVDANGNGFGNEPEDLSQVQNLYIGNGTVIHGEVPLINKVSVPQTIVDKNSALLYADNVSDLDGIARVWAVIRPPDYSAGSATNPVQELPSIDLMPVGDSRFEATYEGFNIEGTYQIAIYARDRIGNTSIPSLTTVSVNTPLRRRAIIVAGGPSSDGLWSAVQTNAGRVYETLIFQGYSDDDIYFLSPVTFSSGVDGLASLSNLNFAIITWAAASTQDVILYLVGRGGAQTFQMNATETLNAADLDTWLDSLQNSLPGNVTVIYDASHSGSFLSLLAPPPTKERIVISSANNNQGASFISDGDISFSTFFWQQVSNGANVRDAFVHGINAIDYAAGGQTPLLDDSGNGIGNELGIDGRMARDHTIGVGIILAGDAPVIGSVSPAQTLSGSASANLWADDVTTTAVIERVWAVITPPGYDANQSDGSNLASIELTGAGAGRYEGTYSNFSLFGTYQIAVYAMDTNGSISLPVVTTAEQTMEADIYEADDSHIEATVIQLNGALPQRHNFHGAGDQDWVKFYAIGGEVYEVKISNVGSRADVVIELYGTDGTTVLKGPWSYGFEGEGELMNWVCPAEGIYNVMVRQLISGDYGADTGYDLEIYRPIGPAAGWVQGMISDIVTGLPLLGVNVRTTGGGSAISLSNGAYLIVGVAGTHDLVAEIPGYAPGTYTDVPVIEYGVTTRNFMLSASDSDNDGIPDAIEDIVACLNPVDDDSDDDGILDGNEDADHDGVVDPGETDPCEEDSDNDGLLDGTEIGLTAPQGTDTDLGIFIPDADPSTTTDPLDDDSDDDGSLDGEEDDDQNGQVDPGETDPNQAESKGLPWLMLLLFGQ